MKIIPTDSPYPAEWDFEISKAEKQWVKKALAKAQKEFPAIDENGLIRKWEPCPFDLKMPLIVARILCCKEFIEACGILKNPSSVDSYELKHYCENWAGIYISNGAFCVAAIGLNVPLRHDEVSVSPRLGISLAGIRKMRGLKRENLY